jgi:hypothetical protein
MATNLFSGTTNPMEPTHFGYAGNIPVIGSPVSGQYKTPTGGMSIAPSLITSSPTGGGSASTGVTNTPAPTGTVPQTGGGTGGDILGANTVASAGGATTTGDGDAMGQADALVTQTQADIDAQKAMEAEESAKREADRVSRIQGIFSPILSELDAQIGLVPEKQQAQENVFESSIATQKQGVETGKQTGLAGLAQSEAEQRTMAKSQGRDLSDTARNLLKAAGFAIGARGAGSSSAVGQAGEAVGKQVLKQKGNIFETLGTNIGKIQLAKSNIESLANQKLLEIDQSRTEGLQEIAQFFGDKIDALKSQKANASAEQASAIDNAITAESQDLLSRLRSLDDTVSALKTQINEWKLNRTASLEDYQNSVATASTPELQLFTTDTGAFTFNKQTGEVKPATGGNLFSSGTTQPETDLVTVGGKQYNRDTAGDLTPVVIPGQEEDKKFLGIF